METLVNRRRAETNLQAKADQTQRHTADNLETKIFAQRGGKHFGQTAMLIKKNTEQACLRQHSSSYFANIMTQTFHTVTTNGKPELERTKSTTQGHTPMLNNAKSYFETLFLSLGVLRDNPPPSQHACVADRVDRQTSHWSVRICREPWEDERERSNGREKWIRYQKHEQSKFINNHLFGLVLNESAY